MKPLRLILPAAMALGVWLAQAGAQTAINLGAASTFGVLGTSTITNTGATTVNGDFGVSPGTAYTGFPPGVVVNGAIHAADVTASQAQADAVTAFGVLAAETFTQDLTGLDLGSRTLATGVYFFSATAQLTGVLTLDAQNDPNARFDFQIGSTLGTAIGSQVLLINGASAANVYWQIGTSATFLTSSSLVGSFLAGASITAGTGTMVDGRLLALGAAVTLDSNSITVPTAIPEPAATAALAAGLMGLVVGVRRISRMRGGQVAS
jgi:type VI secretion system secreted protein VgrG